MKILNFGSLTVDHVYEVDHWVVPKETQIVKSHTENFGGKGLNQGIALAKAGLPVYHAGRVNKNDTKFADYLHKFNINTDYLVYDDAHDSGHTIIEVFNGENRILFCSGTNACIDKEQIDNTFKDFTSDDVLLIQNEISNNGYIIEKAHEKGMYIAFNVAPITKAVKDYPLDYINLFIVNEVEGQELAEVESNKYEDIIAGLQKKFPNAEVILTVGADGSYYIKGDTIIKQDAFKVNTVDSTAAGDTFSGYYLASYLKDKDVKKALELAARASSITVQSIGAAQSIPTIDQVMALYK